MENILEQWASLFAARFKNCSTVARQVMYGFMLHELTLEARREKGNLRNLFMMIVFGDLVGLPLLPPYFAMRLLPYIIPSIGPWKRNLLRERDLTDYPNLDL
jgi:hypothetical protein